MGITAYEKEVSLGVKKTFYHVYVDSINKYTGKRTQMRRRGITSLPKAERVYRELWNACREEKPEGLSMKLWENLIDHYFGYIESRQRSPENPNGFSYNLIRKKQSYVRHTEAWNNRHLELVTPQFVTAYLDEQEKQGMSRLMTNEILQFVKSIFSYGVDLGVLKANPFTGTKARKVPQRRKLALTHEETNELLREAKRRMHPYYEIWMLTLSLGLRRSELAGLKWNDIDWKHGLIYLQRQWIPGEGIVEVLKSRSERVVSIPESLVSFLKEMKLKSTSDFVINIDCNMWKTGQQAKVLRDFCREIEIKEVTHHQLRATHITLALIDGVPLGIVKENVGHAKLSTTDVYFRSAGINMKGQMNRLNIKVPQDSDGKMIPFERIK